MKSSLGILWNALLTASVVTLLAGLFVAAMPPVYRATSIVQGTSEDMLRLRSADFLALVITESSATADELIGWVEQVTSAKLEGVQLLQQKLFIAAGEQPGWINITVEAQNAETATAFANDIARVFTQSQLRVHLTAEEKAMLFKEVERIDAVLSAHVAQNPQLLRYSAVQERNSLEVSRLEQRIGQLREQQNQYRGLLKAMRSEELGSLDEPGVVRAWERLKSSEARYADLASRYGEQHQKMKASAAEREVALQQLQRELDAYDERLESRLESLRGEIAGLQLSLSQTEQTMLELDNKFSEYENLGLARETALARFEVMSEDESSEVFARAVTPGNTLGFNQVMLLSFVFLLSFMLMAVLMVVRGGRAGPST